jgi:hypothetical protein
VAAAGISTTAKLARLPARASPEVQRWRSQIRASPPNAEVDRGLDHEGRGRDVAFRAAATSEPQSAAESKQRAGEGRLYGFLD